MCINFFGKRWVFGYFPDQDCTLILTFVSLPYFNTIQNSESLENLKKYHAIRGKTWGIF